ncbi:hypothetical protein AB0K18_36730 [Nonomuraea sp. NPDC049421]|jgi:hypothetical protein|uniref:Secreted protein n=1 Tax=Nonomuraea salmonea TaxID=46181 RepID=A0ABV5P0N0_9ACTN
MLRRTVSGAFALTVAGLITAAASPALAESQSPADFYDSAAAIINSDGSLNNGTNVVRSWRAGTGRYCVQLDHSVSAPHTLIQLTPREPRRLPNIAYRNPSTTCYRHNTITVTVYDTNTGQLANGGFDLLAI